MKQGNGGLKFWKRLNRQQATPKKKTPMGTHLPPLVVGVDHDTSMDPASKLATVTPLGAEAGRGYGARLGGVLWGGRPYPTALAADTRTQ